MIPALFIGGPADGKRFIVDGHFNFLDVLYLPPQKNYYLAPDEILPIEKITYRREQFVELLGPEVILYVQNDLSLGEALKLLIDGYRNTPDGHGRKK